ncbi:MAG TPA: hypothetical protein VK861_02770, partial [Bacteroidales bacterium]|nr:hypothetical protein [Bacteroidales bacterium]
RIENQYRDMNLRRLQELRVTTSDDDWDNGFESLLCYDPDSEGEGATTKTTEDTVAGETSDDYEVIQRTVVIGKDGQEKAGEFTGNYFTKGQGISIEEAFKDNKWYCPAYHAQAYEIRRKIPIDEPMNEAIIKRMEWKIHQQRRAETFRRLREIRDYCRASSEAGPSSNQRYSEDERQGTSTGASTSGPRGVPRIKTPKPKRKKQEAEDEPQLMLLRVESDSDPSDNENFEVREEDFPPLPPPRNANTVVGIPRPESVETTQENWERIYTEQRDHENNIYSDSSEENYRPLEHYDETVSAVVEPPVEGQENVVNDQDVGEALLPEPVRTPPYDPFSWDQEDSHWARTLAQERALANRRPMYDQNELLQAMNSVSLNRQSTSDEPEPNNWDPSPEHGRSYPLPGGRRTVRLRRPMFDHHNRELTIAMLSADNDGMQVRNGTEPNVLDTSVDDQGRGFFTSTIAEKCEYRGRNAAEYRNHARKLGKNLH